MNRYWFRPKRYGYGATPSTWEGWAATVACALAIILATFWVPTLFRDPDQGHLAALTVVSVIVILFCWVAWTRTEGGWRWRWGDEG